VGAAVKADSGVLCTSLVRDVMNFYLLELELDGFIRDAKARWLPSVHDNQCAGGGPGDPVAQCAGGTGRRVGAGRGGGIGRRSVEKASADASEGGAWC
jgi:hypothetical protein